jgi:GTPase SAR1 family protein
MKEQVYYLQIINSLIALIGQILRDDEEVQLVDHNTKRSLMTLYNKCLGFQHKIDSNIIEIAIIGEESSGKSTFINALTENIKPLLPHANANPIYSQFQFGENKTIVETYSKDEFGHIFSKMLESIKFPNYNNNIYDINRSHITKHIKNLQDNDIEFYRKNIVTIDRVEDVFKNLKELSRLLSDKRIEFDVNEDNKEFKAFLNHKMKSTLIKKIFVQSKKMDKIKNFVIYDFSSFNKISSKFENEIYSKLNSVDLIMYVKDINSGTDLSTLDIDLLSKKMINIDELKLKDKLFVVANKIDMVENKMQLSENIENLKHSLSKKLSFKPDKVFKASSLAHLQQLHPSVNNDFAITRLNRLKLPKNSNSIQNILMNMHDFFRKDAVVNIQVNINNLLNILKDLCLKITKENSKYLEIKNFDFLTNKLFLNTIKEAESFIDENLSNLDYEIYMDITENGYFTKKLKEHVDKSFESIDREMLIRTARHINVSSRKSESPSEINQEVRNILNNEFRDKFKNIVTNIADEKAKEIDAKIMNVFLESFQLKKTNPNYKNVEEATRKLISDLTYEVSYNKKSFVHLIERFSRDLFDVLIKKPFASVDRLKAFKAAEDDFYSLALYYHRLDNEPNFAQPLVAMLLAHKGYDITFGVDKIKGMLKEFLGKLDTDTKFTDEYISDTANYIFNNNISVYTFIEKLREKLEGVSEEFQIFSFVDEISGNTSHRDKETFLTNLTKGLTQSQDLDEVLVEINKDIEFLREILKHAVIKAISLEVPFVSTINNKIRILQDKKSSEEFVDFLSVYVKIIKFKEFSDSEKEKVIYKSRADILKVFQEILEKIEAF